MPISFPSHPLARVAGIAIAALAALHGAPALAAPQVAATIALPDPVRWDYVSVDPAAHRLYVAHRERVDVIDTRDNKPVLQLAPTPGVHGAAAAPGLNRVFTSNGADGTVGVFDATTGKPLQALPAGKNPDAIVYEPSTQRVFAFNGGSSDVTVIDARTLKVLATIPSPGDPEFAVVDGRGRVFFNIEDKGELAVIDAQALKIERHYALAPCEEPSGLAIDPKGRLYSVCRNGVMVVSDPAQGRVIGSAPIGRGPDGVAWLDGKAYSANGRDGTISVVAETAPGRFETIATVPTAPGARTIAAAPGEHLLFSPTADFEPPVASSAAKPPRPEAIVGSFRVLVLKDAEAR
ncbi:YncE family protein [Scleromatobacter humisilvae]|uniref:YncE family protein n=1 Tax=Scleromatobacter humisilvae TaxID=2897159 RepID=A0A9X2BZF8_9BURK|nr:YncE family protein [Scleromatobacter humisilvae]MCK9685321.1 YncE family protein [Scleromatobacter humisilvae]